MCGAVNYAIANSIHDVNKKESTISEFADWKQNGTKKKFIVAHVSVGNDRIYRFGEDLKIN